MMSLRRPSLSPLLLGMVAALLALSGIIAGLLLLYRSVNTAGDAASIVREAVPMLNRAGLEEITKRVSDFPTVTPFAPLPSPTPEGGGRIKPLSLAPVSGVLH